MTNSNQKIKTYYWQNINKIGLFAKPLVVFLKFWLLLLRMKKKGTKMLKDNQFKKITHNFNKKDEGPGQRAAFQT